MSIVPSQLPSPTPRPMAAPMPSQAQSAVGRVGPVAFKSDRSNRSGSRRTVYIDDPAPGLFTFTGEFYPPAELASFRTGQWVLSGAAWLALIGALAAAASEGSGGSTLTTLFFVAALVAVIAQLIWKAVLVRSARPAALQVPVTSLRRVRSTRNYRLLWWSLLIGPFAMIVLFAGRKYLRMEMPVEVGGVAGMLPLSLLEQHRGDADATAMRLRLAGAR